mmetsp:Transcript_33530/g.46786  ORF Transcript_33530/g.46786 Transcript_33530/m.46786 type:complete len:535 (+) Transcript_33530:38-1642(+)
MADNLPRWLGPATPLSSWPNIPVAVIRNIALYSDVVTIIKLTQTCTKLANALNEAFWRDIFVTKWRRKYRTDLIRPLELPNSTPNKMPWITERIRRCISTFVNLPHCSYPKPSRLRPIAHASSKPVWRLACVLKGRSEALRGRGKWNASTARPHSGSVLQIRNHRRSSRSSGHEAALGSPSPSSSSSSSSSPSASSPFDLRQCCVCNQLELLTYGQMERERHPDTLYHSDSRWIKPCSCGTFCHRHCFEDLWAAKTGIPLSCIVTATTDSKDMASSSMSRRVRCIRCNSPYALRKRKTHHHFELASIAFKRFRRDGVPRFLAKHLLRFLAVFIVFSAYQNLQFEGKTMVCYDSDNVGSMNGARICGGGSSTDIAGRSPDDVTVTYETSLSLRVRSPLVCPTPLSVYFCMTYEQLLSIFLSLRFQTAIMRMFPGPLYMRYLQFYGSMLLSFLVYVLAYSPNPFIEHSTLPFIFRMFSYIATAWWFLATTAIIGTFWVSSQRADTPADGRALARNLLQHSGRSCWMCAIGLCVNNS